MVEIGCFGDAVFCTAKDAKSAKEMRGRRWNRGWMQMNADDLSASIRVHRRFH
jgi:hypothetical protein